MSSTVKLLLAGALLFSGAAMLNLRIAAHAELRPYDLTHVPHGPAARVASLGQRGLVSDLYWLAAVQYIGDPKAEQRGWDKLYPLIDLVTDLDPRHGYAYQTAGIVLSASGRLDESDAILEKGIKVGPNYWSFPYYISFNNWFYRGDYAEGARWADIAARTPGASTNVSRLAVSLRSKTGTPEQAIEMVKELLETVKDPESGRLLQEQLKLAIVERDAQRLEAVVAEQERRTGLPVSSLDALVWSGALRELPPDPFGGRYEWDPEKREVHSSVNPFRFRIRDRPRAPTFHYQRPASTEKGATP